MFRHALRNGLIPIVTILGLQMGALMGGAVVTEQIFVVPGFGRLIVEAVFTRDYPLVQGVVLITASAYVLINLLVDVSYSLLNPRIRVKGSAGESDGGRPWRRRRREATPAERDARAGSPAAGGARCAGRPRSSGAVVVLLFALMALAAPWLATGDPMRTNWSQIRKAPTLAHPFGTDDLGRDVFSRVVWGARTSMQAGVLSILLAIAVGVPDRSRGRAIYRGAFDQVIMRLTDAWLSFPFLILAIGLVTILGPSLTNATVAIGMAATPTYIRLTRGLVLATAQEDYVQGARALGGGRRAHDAAAHPSQHLQRAARPGHRLDPDRDHRRGHPLVPRAGRAAAHAELGHHAQHRPAVPRDRPLDGLVARPRHLLAHPVLQPGRRRPARLARSTRWLTRSGGALRPPDGPPGRDPPQSQLGSSLLEHTLRREEHG